MLEAIKEKVKLEVNDEKVRQPEVKVKKEANVVI